MPSRAEFQAAINSETAAATRSGIIAGQFVVNKFWEKPISNDDASAWFYQLGLNILLASYSGPRSVLDVYTHPPDTVLRDMPILETMYSSTKEALVESLKDTQPAERFLDIARHVRIQHQGQVMWHPHFGDVLLKEYQPTFVHTLPLPTIMCGQLGMYSKEFVQRPDTGNRFPVRYSFLYKDYSNTGKDILHGVTFNRRVDKTWPDALKRHMDLGAVALWDRRR